jgi:hypothetical protein
MQPPSTRSTRSTSLSIAEYITITARALQGATYRRTNGVKAQAITDSAKTVTISTFKDANLWATDIVRLPKLAPKNIVSGEAKCGLLSRLV